MNVCFNFLAKKHQEDNGRSVFTALIISYPPQVMPMRPFPFWGDFSLLFCVHRINMISTELKGKNKLKKQHSNKLKF